MTIATLLLTALIWVALGLGDEPGARVAVLAVGAVVAAAIAGDTSQDLAQNLPWGFVFPGMGIAAVVEFVLRLPSLAFAVGLYLPIALSTPIMVGGAIRALIERKAPEEEVEAQREAGILFSSGMVGGAALLGVVIALGIYFFGPEDPTRPAAWVLGHEWMGRLATLIGTLAFAALSFVLYRTARHQRIGFKQREGSES